MQDMKDKINDIHEGIYVVDKDYKIVYMDDYLSLLFTNTRQGDICYRALRGNDEPCKNCPLLKLEDDTSVLSNELMYHDLIECWVNCTMTRIQWPQKGDCTVIAMKKIVNEKRDLFMNFNQGLNYEELFEINTIKQSYELLYYSKGTMSLPKKGNVRELIDATCKELISSKEQKKYIQFMDLSTLQQRIEKIGYVVDDFKILSEGEYHWVSMYIYPVNKRDEEDCYLCFSVDADKKYGNEHKRVEDRLFQLLDPLTGLYNTATFYEKVEKRLIEQPQIPYGLVMIDIEHFKLFNDWYGFKQGDKLLCYIAKEIKKKCDQSNGIAARLGSDDFVMLLPYAACDIVLIESEIIAWMQNYQMDNKFLPTAGIYAIQKDDTSVAFMCDRAAMALQSVKGFYDKRVALYNQAMKQKLENEQEVLSGVKEGLQRHEFEIYYQPQCSARTNRIIGAEALVRWNHPQKGMIAPNEFIPILEASGFISKLDYYVWEEVCRFLHNRRKEGKQVVPVSVNVSRLDIYQYHLLKVFQGLCEKYDLPHGLLEIEITESAYTENFSQLVQAVTQLRKAGFTVLMDDFGSGYSSLNMLKDIEVDVLKLDMKFLDMSSYSMLKGSSILESIIQMGKWLGLRLIAEGVETKEQLNQLLNLDCEYMQGYYFYRPMPQANFETILNQDKLIDVRGIKAERLPTVELDDLFHKDITSEAMLNNILGGIAVYELKDDGQFTIKMVNDKYYRMTGCNAVDLMERSTHIINQVHKDDLEIFKDIFVRAQNSSALGAEGTFRRYRLSGEIMWMHLHAFFLRKQGDTKTFYGSVTDYSDKMRLERELLMVLDTIPGNIIEYRVEDGLQSRIVCAGLAKEFGYSKEVYNMLMKENYGLSLIHEDDRSRVKEILSNPSSWGNSLSFEYRGICENHDIIWLEQHITFIGKEEDVAIYNSLCTNITKLKNQEIELFESQKVLCNTLSVTDFASTSVDFTLENKRNAAYLFAQLIPGGMIGGYCEEGFPIYFANEEMISMLGYTSYQDMVNGLHGMVENTIYEEDRMQVMQDIGEEFYEGLEYTSKYRMVRKDGSLFWVIDKGRVVKEENGRLAIISACMDIDETMKVEAIV